MLDAATRGVWQMDTLLFYIHQGGSDKMISECTPSYRPITVDLPHLIFFVTKLGYFETVLDTTISECYPCTKQV